MIFLGLTPKRYTPLGGTTTDADAQAFITAAGITDGTQQSAVNQLVLDLKSANIWTKMKAIYPILGGSASSHKWNLKDARDLDAAFRLTFSTGWTHSSTGMTPTNAFANTFYTPSVNGIIDSAHISFYSRTDTNTNQVDIGTQISSSYHILQLRVSNVFYALINQSGLSSTANTNSTGFYIGNRQASNNIDLFKNGTKTDTTTATALIPNSSVYIGANNGGSPNYSSKECSFVSLGDGLTDTEAALLYQITEKYQVTLGRNINPTQSFYYNGAYDNDTNIFLFNAQITDTTQQTAVNTLVSDLKTYNIWSKMKAVYPIVGGTAATHAVNLTGNTTFNLTFTLGWTHSSNGMTPNGTSAYADTFLIPANILTTNSNHFSVYTRTNQTTNAVPLGSYTDSNRLNQLNISTNTGLVYYTGSASTELLSSLTDSKGFFIGTTRANNDRKTFRNGVQQQSLTTLVGTNYSIFKMYLGARNTAGSAGSYTVQQIAFASIGDGLTDTEAANFNTAVNAYQVALNRNI